MSILLEFYSQWKRIAIMDGFQWIKWNELVCNAILNKAYSLAKK